MGRKACTEPQCLYKGAFFLLPAERRGYDINNLGDAISRGTETFRYMRVSV